MAHKTSKDHYLAGLFCTRSDDKTNDESMELSRLSDITDNFSKRAEIGSGAFSVVYKGVLLDGFVAVKKLKVVIDNKAFLSEVNCLRTIDHPNIVQYIGYCAGSYGRLAMYDQKDVLKESLHQLICFEYLQNGSLGKHLENGTLTNQPCGLPWHLCYKIIQGICLGLHHLHQYKIIHRDIKPDNILLDDDMSPKIADFGLSRLLGEGKSRIETDTEGTLGYMAPECFEREFTFKSDVYSLGVIIQKMVMGHSKASKNETVLMWSHRLNLDASQRPNALDEVEACIDISVRCTEKHKAETRPGTSDILRILCITETGGCITETSPVPLSSMGKESKLEAESSLAGLTKIPGDTIPEKLERTSSTWSKILPSKTLRIEHNSPRYWKWFSIPDSRFGECAELLNVYFLAVTGEIPPSELSAGTSYEVHLVYKLARKTIGLRGSIQTSSLRLHGEKIIASNKVCLEPKVHGMEDDVTYPIERSDGWLELRLAEFLNDDKMLTEKGVIVDLREENDTIKKSGLIVAGIEFRSN